MRIVRVMVAFGRRHGIIAGKIRPPAMAPAPLAAPLDLPPASPGPTVSHWPRCDSAAADIRTMPAGVPIGSPSKLDAIGSRATSRGPPGGRRPQERPASLARRRMENHALVRAFEEDFSKKQDRLIRFYIRGGKNPTPLWPSGADASGAARDWSTRACQPARSSSGVRCSSCGHPTQR